jgi:X-Pro dipeptidyl-peptidase
VLARTAAGAIALQAPAAPSNGDWIEPASQGQLWRIAPARVTEATIATTTSVVSSAPSSLAGQPVTFTATIAGGSPLSGGTVTFTDGSAVLGAVTLAAGQTVASLTTSALAPGVHTITAAFGGDAINAASRGQVVQTVSAYTSQTGGVSGAVPATLSLTLGGSASFGTFLPGADHVYETSTTADVVSTAGDAALTVSDPGHLRNGAFTLPQPLQVLGVPKAYAAPVSHDVVTIGFRQPIAATDALRTGTYATTLTFTLSTTSP